MSSSTADPSETTGGEFARSWPVVVAAAIGIGIGVASSPFYTAGLFLKALTAEFGWSRAGASSGSLALSLGIALAAPVVGRLADRLGSRAVAVASMLLLAASFFGLSRMAGQLSVYIGAMFLMGLVAAGSSPITFTRAVSSWFTRGRGLALGLALVGTGLMATLAPLVLGPLIERQGWRHGYAALAAAALVATPFLLLVRDRRSDATAPHVAASVPVAIGAGAPVWRDPHLWILLATTILAAFSTAGLAVSLVPMLTDMGSSPEAAARSASVMGLAVIFGRVAAGAAFDRVFAPRAGAAMLLLAGAGCLLLAWGGSAWSIAAAATIGLALGAEIDLMAFLTARYFPISRFGRVYGLIYAGALVAAGLGPIAAGAVYDLLGGYGWMLVGEALILASSAALLLMLAPYPVHPPERCCQGSVSANFMTR